MRLGRHIITLLVLAFAVAAPGAHGQDQIAADKAAYERSSITRYLEMFSAQDVDRSDQVTREQVLGNVEFIAVFDDMDINRDGIVTKAELDRYLGQRFGYAPPR